MAQSPAPGLAVDATSSDGRDGQEVRDSPRGPRPSLRWGRWLAAVLVLALAGAAGYYWTTHRQAPSRFVTAPVTRGSVAVALTATGTVNPVTVVEVGTYVSGPIVRWSCDYNTRVTVGQLCAQIDPRAAPGRAPPACASRRRAAWADRGGSGCPGCAPG